ncbi:MAG TPA: hypothetical protein VKU82_01325 [Planctomycetaceae bacterium]|nr:hypothetical protein [Planctomycetaceae bacterium]
MSPKAQLIRTCVGGSLQELGSAVGKAVMIGTMIRAEIEDIPAGILPDDAVAIG